MAVRLIVNPRRPPPRDLLPDGVEVLASRSPSHARELAAQAVAEGVDRLLVAGGDGSVQTVLPALSGSATVLGLLPRGTGNDLAACLGLPHEPGAAVRMALEAPGRRVDLLEVRSDDLRDLAAVGVAAGAAARVQGRLDGLRRRRPRLARALGRWGFLLTALAEAWDPRPLPCRVEWPGGVWDGEALGILVFIRERFGGGFPVPDLGRPDDGRMKAVVLREPGSAPARLVRTAALRRGRYEPDWCERILAPELRIRSPEPVPLILDGEYRRRRDPEIRVLPGALRVAGPDPGLSAGPRHPGR